MTYLIISRGPPTMSRHFLPLPLQWRKVLKGECNKVMKWKHFILVPTFQGGVVLGIKLFVTASPRFFHLLLSDLVLHLYSLKRKVDCSMKSINRGRFIARLHWRNKLQRVSCKNILTWLEELSNFVLTRYSQRLFEFIFWLFRKQSGAVHENTVACTLNRADNIQQFLHWSEFL